MSIALFDEWFFLSYSKKDDFLKSSDYGRFSIKIILLSFFWCIGAIRPSPESPKTPRKHTNGRKRGVYRKERKKKILILYSIILSIITLSIL